MDTYRKYLVSVCCTLHIFCCGHLLTNCTRYMCKSHIFCCGHFLTNCTRYMCKSHIFCCGHLLTNCTTTWYMCKSHIFCYRHLLTNCTGYILCKLHIFGCGHLLTNCTRYMCKSHIFCCGHLQIVLDTCANRTFSAVDTYWQTVQDAYMQITHFLLWISIEKQYWRHTYLCKSHIFCCGYLLTNYTRYTRMQIAYFLLWVLITDKLHQIHMQIAHFLPGVLTDKLHRIHMQIAHF